MYHTLIVPVALYGLKVATITKQNRNSLRKMENTIVTRLRELARDPPTATDVATLLNGKTIVKKSRVGRLKYWGHVARRPPHHILQLAMNFRLTGKLKVGRPCFTWNDTVHRDMDVSGIDNWDSTVMDPTKHNAKCDQFYLNENDSD